MLGLAMVSGKERRQHQRRTLPFGRSAVLAVGGRDHIVSVVDLSRGGAYLGTRLEIGREDELWLKLLLPRASSHMRLPCRLVRRIPASPAGERLPGLAVEFGDLDDDARQKLQEFVLAGGSGIRAIGPR
jgi:hypothetical protein